MGRDCDKVFAAAAAAVARGGHCSRPYNRASADSRHRRLRVHRQPLRQTPRFERRRRRGARQAHLRRQPGESRGRRGRAGSRRHRRRGRRGRRGRGLRCDRQLRRGDTRRPVDLGAAEFIETDVYGTFVLLEWARTTGGRLVHVSTDEVYGDLEAGARRRRATRCDRRARTPRPRRAAISSSSPTFVRTTSTRSSPAAPTRTGRTSTRRR